MQLRTGHTPLNKHLFCFKRSNTPNCLQCGDITPETVHHLLFACPRYDHERFVLERDTGRRAFHTAYLLSNANARKHFLSYINETKHLKQTFSEVYSCLQKFAENAKINFELPRRTPEAALDTFSS